MGGKKAGDKKVGGKKAGDKKVGGKKAGVKRRTPIEWYPDNFFQVHYPA